MSLSTLSGAVDGGGFDMVSTDVFDTVLLRDHTTESARLAIACRRAATKVGVDPRVLTRLRWDFHVSAYQAVDVERPQGEASLGAICRTVAAALGLGDDAARVLRTVETDVDIEHLRPHRALLDLLDVASRAGRRVVAVSDTWYSEADLRRVLDGVIGPHPITSVYSSADVGLTKHAGGLFAEVALREDVPAARIVHVGDNWRADVEMADAAGWTAIHLPRSGRFRAEKLVGKVMSARTTLRRNR